MKTKLNFLTLVFAIALSACSSPTPTAAPAATAISAPVATAAPVATTAPQPTSAPQNTPAAQSTTAPATSGDSLNFVLDGNSEARYRVREQLAGVNLPSDAIGATKAITGVIVTTKEGKIVKEQSKITIDISKLQSDKSQRDNFLRNSVLQTSRFANVVFVPTEAQGLAWPVKDGAIEFKLLGDLTVRDVTKPVSWDVKLTVTGNEAKGQATTSFKFGFFNIEQPRVPVVLSIEDNIKLEIDLVLKKQ